MVDSVDSTSCLLQTIGCRRNRKPRILLLPRKTLLSSGGNDPAIFHQSSCTVVIISREPEDAHAVFRSEQGVDEGRERGSGCQHDQAPEQCQNDQDGQQPELLPFAKEG